MPEATTLRLLPEYIFMEEARSLILTLILTLPMYTLLFFSPLNLNQLNIGTIQVFSLATHST